MTEHKGWIGVDLDGTLAHYEGWKGVEHIGAPIPKMVERIKNWLADGVEVRIFTARIWHPDPTSVEAFDVKHFVEQWCIEHLGQKLPVTCTKDFGMIELWDDRAVQVKINTGEPVGYSTRGNS